MLIDYPPTVKELQAAWRRAGLWRLGISYARAQASPLLLWSMSRSALAARRRHHLPAQPALF